NLPQSVKDAATAKAQRLLKQAGGGQNSTKPPRDELVRAQPEGFELRDDGESTPTMVGHFARFNEWTEIDSIFEGNFMERVAPGAFKKTFAEMRQRMRVLFQHGQDPQIGDKPLGPISVLEEDREGAYSEGPCLTAPYVRADILPGCGAGLYGSSFRFSVQREQFDRDAKPSAYNPKGLPERTLKEIAIREFGPVTFPAYAGATAGVRSLTDEFMLARYTRNPEIARKILGSVRLDQVALDSEDLDYLGQMLQLAATYIAEQDEPDDQRNIPKMEAIMAGLVELAQYEASESEEAEDEDDGRNAPPAGAAREGTPVRDAAYTWLDVKRE